MRAWSRITTRWGSPLALASLMKSCRRTSIMPLLVNLRMRANWKRHRVIPGRIRCLRPSREKKATNGGRSARPEEGKTPQVTLKTRTRIMPIQNVGTEMPASEKNMMPLLNGDSGLTEAMMPRGMPRPTARIMAKVASSRVAGNLSMTTVRADWP